MSEIRYVCLSDLHFGQSDGLLTNLSADRTMVDVRQPSPVLVALCDGLRALLAHNPAGRRPVLILNGDVLETALTTMNEAAMAFERFIELALPPGDPLFERIVYVPGNHDHHVWEMARETQYVNHVRNDLGGNPILDEPWHTTNMLVDEPADERLVGYFLTNLLQRHAHLKTFQVEIAYPNFGLHRPEASRAVVFHHGHFVEGLYHLMTKLANLLFPERPQPEMIWDLEAENFAWIDFFWSTLGRSGDVGPRVQEVYLKSGYAEARDKLIDTLARSLAANHDLPGWGDRMERAILKSGLKLAADWVMKRERHTAPVDWTDELVPLSSDAREGLETYVNRYVLGQLGVELEGPLPERLGFVFGHTHKPYQRLETCVDFDGDVDVWNTGGFVVESVEPAERHGATAVLLDDDLATVALHLYHEGDYEVRVKDADPEHIADNALAVHVQGAIDADAEVWQRFSEAVEAEITAHEAFLARAIDE